MEAPTGLGLAVLAVAVAVVIPTVASGGSDAAVLQATAHNMAGHHMALSHDEALLLAFRAELNGETPTTIPHDTTTRTEEEER